MSGNDRDQELVAPAVTYRSPILNFPGACPPAEDSPDSGVAWHYGDPLAEQRTLAAGTGVVDLSHRGVITVTGPDRLSWLHSLTTQQLEDLPVGASTTALILSPHGHVEHEMHVIDDGITTWLTVEPGVADSLVAHLDRMRFMLRVDVADVSSETAVVWQPVREAHPDLPSWLTPETYAEQTTTDTDVARYVPVRPNVYAGREVLVPRDSLESFVRDNVPAIGTWALEATRIAAGVPRVGFETDHRTIPHELGWVPIAVHLHKGCYRGQETVARVHNLGRPPRRLVLLHLDGSANRDVRPGDGVFYGEKSVGRVTSAVQHYELGPIALAVIKRATPADAALLAEDVAATQEVIVVGG